MKKAGAGSAPEKKLKVTYSGMFSKDKRDGFGKLAYNDSSFLYEGQWQGDKKEGKGKMQLSDKRVIKGVFSKNHLIDGTRKTAHKMERANILDTEV